MDGGDGVIRPSHHRQMGSTVTEQFCPFCILVLNNITRARLCRAMDQTTPKL